MAITSHRHPDELAHLGKRLIAAHESLRDAFGAFGVKERDIEEILGSETIGALDTVKEIGERLIPAGTEPAR